METEQNEGQWWAVARPVECAAMTTIVFQPRPEEGRCLRAAGPMAVLQTRRPGEVRPLLEEVQAALHAGRHAAGFLAYEAAAGLDERMAVRPDCPLPLAWFGVFDELGPWEPAAMIPAAAPAPARWEASISREQYERDIARIKAYIAAGDTYQVNHTFRYRSALAGDAWAFHTRLCRAQRAAWSSYIDTTEHIICSASPELFFDLAGGVITCRPMKGTAPRSADPAEDRRLKQALAGSAKNRAENAMIVDMMRNDLGRIAQVGSVKVERAFAIEEYPTVWQMTSTITARTGAALPEIMAALFPCASVTGAPKIRTMEIIRELESAPRGIYTGCIGHASPGGEMRFNVAIRTATIHTASAAVEYGVGGGIVWDSQPAEEYAECITKAAVLGK